MEENVVTPKKKHIAFYIVFPIVYILISLLLIFYLDLANGPLAYFVIQIVLLVALLVMRILFINKKFWQRLLVWVGFGALTIGVLLLSTPKVEPKRAVAHSNIETVSEVLQLKNGKVQGVYNEDKSVEVYAGIPYATAERWKLPKEFNWEGVRDGSYFGARSMQPLSNPVMDSLVDIYAEKGWHPDYNMYPYQNMAEDALYLNIWKPSSTATNLPILVYIHGGSLTSGSSARDEYNGEEMAKLGIVFITIQYRLGVFGYFAHPDLAKESLNENGFATTGNYGLIDQITALKWINENASYFNGDKNNITIAGESAGSSSVSALCTSPLAKGLFKRAIGESSSLAIKVPPHTYRSKEKAYETSANILKEYRCSSIEELRKVSAAELVKTTFSNSSMMLDGYALTKDPYQVYLDGENNEEALLNGYNVKEADAFVVPTFLLSPTNKNNIKERLESYFDKEYGDKIYDLYKEKIEQDAFSAFNEIISVYWFIMPHHSWSNLALNNGVDVYRYQFTKENGYYGTYHSGEIIYCYGNLGRSRHKFAYNQSDYDLSKTMMGYWSNFAKTGNPNGDSLPTWNKYLGSKDGVMELGSNVGKIEDKYLALYELLDKFISSK